METSNKRNYIRRKKYLNESAEQIKKILDFISFARGEMINEEKSRRQAFAHAEAIEAACWSPRARLTSDGYHSIMTTKTQELCQALLHQEYPHIDFQRVKKAAAENNLQFIIPHHSHTTLPNLSNQADNEANSILKNRNPTNETPTVSQPAVHSKSISSNILPLPLLSPSAPKKPSAEISFDLFHYEQQSFEDSYETQNEMNLNHINVDELLTFNQDQIALCTISDS